jgi:CHAT domain-containing protein/Tfp pilus assembly protein PilF
MLVAWRATGALDARQTAVPLPAAGTVHRATLNAGEVRRFLVTAATPALVDVTAIGERVDVALTLRAANGTALATIDDFQTTYESERMIGLTDADGVAVEVTARGAGAFRLTVTEHRARRDGDASRAAALESLRAAYRERIKATPESMGAAIAGFQSAAAQFHSAGDGLGEAQALQNLAFARMGRAERDPAILEAFERARDLFRAGGQQVGVGNVIVCIGQFHALLGERRRAIAYYEEALAIHHAQDDRRAEAYTLNMLGQAYVAVGQKQKGLDLLRRSVEMDRDNGHGSVVGTALHNLGSGHYSIGSWDAALDYYEQSIALSRAEGDRASEAITLNNMGTVHAARGDPAAAIKYYEASLTTRRGRVVFTGEAAALNNLGWAYDALGRREEARTYFERALAEWKVRGDRAGEAATLNNLGRVQAALGDVPGGLETLERALELRRSVGDAAPEALTLFHIARILRDAGRFDESLARVESALGLIETLRRSLTSPELRAAFLASVLDYYELTIDVLMSLDAQHPGGSHAAQALHVAERARARSLLESLAESRADIRPQADQALLARLADLQDALDTRSEAQTALTRRAHTPEAAAVAAKAVGEVSAEIRDVQRRIFAADSRYAALVEPDPLDLPALQKALSDRETTLVEVTLGARRSFAWIIKAGELVTVALPARGEIEAAAEAFHRAIGANQAVAADTAAQQLSRLLMAPIAAHLTTPRIVIVADGSLQMIPFAALPQPDAPKQRLIDRYEIVMAPSLSTLAWLRAHAPGATAARRTLAVIADPVFDRDDPRVTRAAQTATVVPVRSATLAPAAFGRLIGSRREAQGLLALVPRSDRFEALDFDASRATVTSGALSSARFVHFATHATVDGDRPDLSGLVLSLVDRRGNPVNGFLRLPDIYNLRLSADLVVLSACQTALGKPIRGEGMIGLVRGFMYAGAPRVVASLWQVDDRVTADLVQRLYRHMLGPSRLPAAAALRKAQRELAATTQYQSPYYWAGFVLQGDWR